MPYEKPTLQEIIDRIIADLNSEVDDSTTFLRRSVFDIFSKIYGASNQGLYDYIQFVKDQLFISTADAEHLERHGAEYGINRSFGSKAVGSAIASGVAGTNIVAGTQLQSGSGNLYNTNSSYTIDAGGTVTISFTAKEASNAYNEDGGVVLSFISPITNINSTVVVTDVGITGGDDPDSNNEYRDRILIRKRQPPHGGATFDYEQWALEYSGVTRAWAISEYNGIGTIGLIFVLDDEPDIFPDETTRNAVRAYIVEHTDPVTGLSVGVPTTAEPGFLVPVSFAYVINFTIQLDPNTSSVQTLATSRLTDLFLARGGPAQTISISQMYEAIGSALGENKSRIISPTEDQTAPVNQIHVLGTITYQDYL